jgi:hypothetical protein
MSHPNFSVSFAVRVYQMKVDDYFSPELLVLLWPIYDSVYYSIVTYAIRSSCLADSNGSLNSPDRINFSKYFNAHLVYKYL